MSGQPPFENQAIKEEYTQRILAGEMGPAKASREIQERFGVKISSGSLKKRVHRRRKSGNTAKDHPGAAQATDGDVADLAGYWDKTAEGYSLYYKVNREESEPVNFDLAFENILERYTGKLPKIETPQVKAEKFALRLITSDEHVGMDCMENRSLFGYEYSGEIYMDKVKTRVKRALFKEFQTHGAAEVLFLDGLGDFQDGWGGKTTRGGHDLPQNMSEEEVFETCIEAKIELIRFALDHGMSQKVIIRSVLNDNHSGKFARVVNQGLKMICNAMFGDKVEVDGLNRFIEHRPYGKHAHLLCHGKDDQHRRSGLPLNLDHKTTTFITDFIEFEDIKSPFIHFDKGDLHQIGFNRTKRFSYRNFPSFAPPSGYVQDSYGDSVSAFCTQVIPKLSGEICHTEHHLNYNKARV